MEILTKTAHHSPEKIVGLILAGGQARRMGKDTDKAFLSLAGRPLLTHILERMTPQVDQIVISANGDPKRFSMFDLPVFSDLRSGFQGPLAGVETAFTRTEASWILSVAVDLPFLPKNLAKRMQKQQEHTTSDVPRIAVSADRCHYVVCLWPRVVLENLTLALENKQLRLHDWFQSHPHQKVVFPSTENGLDPFFNINRPMDLQVAESALVGHDVEDTKD